LHSFAVCRRSTKCSGGSKLCGTNLVTKKRIIEERDTRNTIIPQGNWEWVCSNRAPKVREQKGTPKKKGKKGRGIQNAGPPGVKTKHC